MKFTESQQQYINAAVERRLRKLRRQLDAAHEAQLARVRAACSVTLNSLSAECERLRSERNALVNEKWSLREQINELHSVRRAVVRWFKR